MKSIIKIFIVIIVAIAIIVSPVLFKTKTLKVKNITLDVSNAETVKVIDGHFRIGKINGPHIQATRGIFYDPYDENINYIHFDINQKNWILTTTALDGKIVKNIDLAPRDVKSEGLSKAIFDKNDIYVGADETIFIIKKSDYSIDRIKLPPRKYVIDSNLVPNKDVSKGSIIDIEKVGKYIAISRNNENGILFLNLNNKKFEEWKLPEKFGSINKIVKFNDNIIFITNFYSGKGGYVIKDQFGKLNLTTKEFDIFPQPVQKLFVVKNSVWGVDMKGNLFTLDTNLKYVKKYNLGVFIISQIIPSNGKIWFVGSDVNSIDGKPLVSSIDDNPPMDAIKVIILKTDKPIFFIGCFDPEKGKIEKSYLPVSKPGPVYGIAGIDMNKINSKFKSSVTIPTGIIDAKTHGILLFAGKIFQIMPNPVKP